MTVELTASDDNDYITFINPRSFDRNDVIFTEFKGKYIKKLCSQVYTNLDGVEPDDCRRKIPPYEAFHLNFATMLPKIPPLKTNITTLNMLKI